MGGRRVARRERVVADARGANPPASAPGRPPTAPPGAWRHAAGRGARTWNPGPGGTGAGSRRTRDGRSAGCATRTGCCRRAGCESPGFGTGPAPSPEERLKTAPPTPPTPPAPPSPYNHPPAPPAPAAPPAAPNRGAAVAAVTEQPPTTATGPARPAVTGGKAEDSTADTADAAGAAIAVQPPARTAGPKHRRHTQQDRHQHKGGGDQRGLAGPGHLSPETTTRCDDVPLEGHEERNQRHDCHRGRRHHQRPLVAAITSVHWSLNRDCRSAVATVRTRHLWPLVIKFGPLRTSPSTLPSRCAPGSRTTRPSS